MRNSSEILAKLSADIRQSTGEAHPDEKVRSDRDDSGIALQLPTSKLCHPYFGQSIAAPFHSGRSKASSCRPKRRAV